VTFQLVLNEIQHIKHLLLELNLDEHKLTCVVGKNGVGKTTLVRAFRNLARADTFSFTAASNIFSTGSSIQYRLSQDEVIFTYDKRVKSLNCRASIPPQMKEACTAELPMPHGDRFNYFQSISKADAEIRRQITLEEFERPSELIEFLSDIYSTNRFDSLIEVKVGNRSYYCLLRDNNRYVREDYLSSGEHFLINLYRTIKGSARLIVVDEIDLSLDAAAQVHLVRKLRAFCQHYRCNVLFTTHSLAMMRMLEPTELLLMESNDGVVTFTPAPYSYIKSVMFGFRGWDRYILTEDILLAGFIEHIIQHVGRPSFYQYKIIHVGGATQVVDLLNRNSTEHFLSTADHVIAILDGDQADRTHAQRAQVFCVPVENVEQALHAHYSEDYFPFKLPAGMQYSGHKDLYHSLRREGVSDSELYQFLCEQYREELRPLVAQLESFLTYTRPL